MSSPPGRVLRLQLDLNFRRYAGYFLVRLKANTPKSLSVAAPAISISPFSAEYSQGETKQTCEHLTEVRRWHILVMQFFGWGKTEPLP